MTVRATRSALLTGPFRFRRRVAAIGLVAAVCLATGRADATPASASSADSLLNRITQGEVFGPSPAPDAPVATEAPSAETAPTAPPTPVLRPSAAPGGFDAPSAFGSVSGHGPRSERAVAATPSVPRPSRSANAGDRERARLRLAQAGSVEGRAARDIGDDLDAILSRGTLRVGTTLFAPYAMRDAAGTLIGHEIDIALAIGADLGVEVEFVPLTETELVGALERESIDVIIAAYAVTPSRAVKVTFTRPYANRNVHLIAAKRGAPRGDEVSDFNREWVNVGLARGTPGEGVVTDALSDATLVRFPDPQEAKTALLEDKVKVLIAESPFPEVLVAQSPDRFMLPLSEPLYETALSFAIRGGNPDLLAYLDAWILARTKDRFLDKTRSYWFDSTDWLPRLTEAPRIDRIDATVR